MGKFTKMVSETFKAVTDLRVITIVGDVTVKSAFKDAKTEIEIASDQKSIVTSINLIEGDITYGIDPEFAPGKESAVRDFHERQVELGQTIIERNVTLLKDIAKELIEMSKEEPPETEGLAVESEK